MTTAANDDARRDARGRSRAATLRSLGAGLVGFVVYGGWAGWVNLPHGEAMALRAGALQGSYSLVLTFVSTLLMEAIHARIAHRPRARTGTIAITGVILLAVPVTLHMLAGTAEILAAIAPGFALGMVYTTVYVNALARVHGARPRD